MENDVVMTVVIRSTGVRKVRPSTSRALRVFRRMFVRQCKAVALCWSGKNLYFCCGNKQSLKILSCTTGDTSRSLHVHLQGEGMRVLLFRHDVEAAAWAAKISAFLVRLIFFINLLVADFFYTFPSLNEHICFISFDRASKTSIHKLHGSKILVVKWQQRRCLHLRLFYAVYWYVSITHACLLECCCRRSREVVRYNVFSF